MEKILEKFIAKELLPWAKRFPDDFYKGIFSLKGWEYKLTGKRPSVVGHYTNDLVYARLAPGVLDELRRITPRDDKGRRKHKFHQRLTEDIGHPKLQEHLIRITTLMKATTNWDKFLRLVERALPKYNSTISLPFPKDDLSARGEN